MEIIDIKQIDEANLIHFFEEECGGNRMVVSSGDYVLSESPGFVAFEKGIIQGAVTYSISKGKLELVSLNSRIENQGIATRLINQVKQTAQEYNIKTLCVTTTNENIKAMLFYQKRGFRFSEIIVDAVTKTRKLKPSIPLYSEQGIPIHDEIVFVLQL